MKKELCVTMCNQMIRAAHNLKLQEKRVLMLAIANLDRDHFKTSNAVVRLQVSEIQKTFHMDSSSAHREVKKVVRELRKRYLRFYEVHNGKKYETDISWTTKAVYADSEGWIELSLNQDLGPGLMELKSHFTKYPLSRVGALRSLYAWRLFELLMQFKKTGYVKIGIEEFHDAMESSKSYRNDFSLLRSRVIEPAVKEIYEKDGLKVKWSKINEGRKVATLEFYFPVEQQKDLALKKTYTRADLEKDNSLAKAGESYEQALKRLNSRAN